MPRKEKKCVREFRITEWDDRGRMLHNSENAKLVGCGLVSQDLPVLFMLVLEPGYQLCRPC